MDILDVVEEVKDLLSKFNRLDKEELKRLRLLSRNLSCDIDDLLYDMSREEVLKEGKS